MVGADQQDGVSAVFYIRVGVEDDRDILSLGVLEQLRQLLHELEDEGEVEGPEVFVEGLVVQFLGY